MASAVRSAWSGSVSFGMVQFPVRLYNAASEKTLRFNNIHRKCGNKVSGPTVCRPCGGMEITDRADLIKGYELSKDQLVHLEETDFEALPLASIKAIEVVATVDPSDVAPQTISKSYWMGPDDRNKVGDKAFVMFRDALGRSGRVAIGRIAMSNKERLAAITARGKVLEVSLLFWNDELNGSESVEATIDDIEVSEKEAALADRLMASLETTIEEAYDIQQDEYRAALMTLIESKLDGSEPIFSPAAATSSAEDLMAALEASLDMAA